MHLHCDITEAQVFFLKSKILFNFLIQKINIPAQLNKIGNIASVLQLVNLREKELGLTVIRILLNQFYQALLWNVNVCFCSKYIVTYFMVIHVKWNYDRCLTPKHTDTWYVPWGTYMWDGKMCGKRREMTEKMAGQGNSKG